MARHEATERQVQAAQPSTSTWLAANAGSGKTKVLTDRVARLLLNGVEPQKILCLTYTKAAASEMQNRLFGQLGAWAMRDSDDLRSDLQALGVEGAISEQELRHARTLFAAAIETPGGLKIQTIHSFCASLLRRFPLEAGVSPQFTEMEDRAAALLRAEIVDDFSDGPQAGLVDDLVRYVTDGDLDNLTAAIVRKRNAFKSQPSWPELAEVFGLPVNAGTDAPLSVAFDGSEANLIRRVVPILREQANSMVALADDLTSLNLEHPDSGVLERLYALFLKRNGTIYHAEAKTGSVPTKNTQKALGPLLEPFLDFMLRVAQARETELALSAAQKSRALLSFANVFLPEYARRKQRRGWLDFDDLIEKARDLVNDPVVASWVLYRLDGGIDHILVDEAQDTSPEQWDVIEKLTQDFTSGLSARDNTERTIFVVGDKKQSIYSFQGADPDAFDQMQSEFSERLRASGSSLESLTLEFSFRSSTAILGLVDQIFDGLRDAGFEKEEQHRAFKPDLPGRVDLWPLVPKVDESDDRHWTDPVDRPSPRHHTVVLAERIANGIKEMIDRGASLPVDGQKPGYYKKRAVRPGDFLILVQRRSDLFAEIIRACKAANLPIAGADRLKVGAELAVRDLAALLSFLGTPEDSLSLATVLRSPLFGWSEQDLFDLAHKRDGPYLWAELRNKSAKYPHTMEILTDLMGQTDFLRPYDLIERILTRHEGRRKLVGRLGAEAEDGIDALLSQALAYERTDIPSLTGFLGWMQTDDLEIKRQIDSNSDQIRVMTVHGAKGLESPIVILPDTGARRAPSAEEIMVADNVPLWKTQSAVMPRVLTRIKEDKQARQMNERLRLLYVALTRAETWLIVAAAGELARTGDSWYDLVRGAMESLGAEETEFDGGSGMRLSHGDWDGLESAKVQTQEAPRVTLPEMFRHSAPPLPPPTATLQPSDLGGAKALPGESGLDEEAAKLRGARVHVLLEKLPDVPRDRWADACATLLVEVDPLERHEIVAEATAVLETPGLQHVFGKDTLAEVPITAELGYFRLHGTIDRLILSNDSVCAVDFKTNAVVPAAPDLCPDGLLRQMGAYEAALRQIYPDRRVETALLWTRTCQLMLLPHDLVTNALNSSPSLDDLNPRS